MSKRSRCGRPKEPGPHAVVTFFSSEPDISGLIEQAHDGGTVGGPYEYDPKAGPLLIRAVADLTANVPLGQYLAYLMSRKFRYVYDPTQPKTQAQMTLYSFDGVRYTDQAGATVSNMEVNAHAAARNIAARLRDLLGAVKEAHPPPPPPPPPAPPPPPPPPPPVDEAADVEDSSSSEDESVDVEDSSSSEYEEEEGEEAAEEEAGGEEAPRAVTVVDARNRLDSFLRRLDRAAYLREAYGHMHKIMKTNGFYAGLGLASPADFYHQLDANPDLMGFANGIMNFREPDKSFKFYAAGDVPADFAVSYTTGYTYTGPDVWLPGAALEYQGLTDEQRAKMQAAEDATIGRFFFAPAMYTAAVFVIGCLFFGGNQVKKLILLLGEAGDNGKTALVLIIKLMLGEYAGFLPKAVLTESKNARDANPNAASPFWCHVYKLRAVFITETDENDVISPSAAKGPSGGDPIPMRANYGNPFYAVVLPLIFWVSNHAPKHDGSKALVTRLYAVSCDAKFAEDTVVEDKTRGVWKLVPKAEFEAHVRKLQPDMLLLFISYARLFADAGYTLPPAPAGAAAEALADGAAGRDFETWFSTNYVSTLTPGTNLVEWAAHRGNGAIKLNDLLYQYDTETAEKVDTATAKTALKRLGFRVGSVIHKSPGTGDPKDAENYKAPFAINYNSGVKACRKDELEKRAKELGEELGERAEEQQ